METLIVALGSAGFASFISYCLKGESIFGPEGKFPMYSNWLKKNSDKFYTKPLGLCVYCMGFRVALFLGLFLAPAEHILLVIGISHVALFYIEMNIKLGM